MSRIRHDRIRLYMIKADSFCVRGSVEYPVKMELGSFRTMTGIPGTGTKYFFIKEFEISF